MQKYKISKRLLALKEYATKIKSPILSIADIGTDHGYLPYACFQSGIVNRSILCDINQGPLDNAIQTFKNAPFESAVEFRLGSGLEPLEAGEVDLVFIAGMGGGLIRDLLSNDLDKSKSFPHYILQPMTEQSELRNWLLENKFSLLWDGFMQESGKHYEVLVVASAVQNAFNNADVLEIPGFDLEFGVRILEDEKQAYVQFLLMKQKKYETILLQITNHKSEPEALSKVQFCQTKLQTIINIKKALGLS